MTPGTTAEDYTAQFEMLVGWTGFNNEALKDAYIQGLPNSILQRVFTQITLPKGLWNDISEVDISDLVAKAINTALNTQEKKGKAKEEAKVDF